MGDGRGLGREIDGGGEGGVVRRCALNQFIFLPTRFTFYKSKTLPLVDFAANKAWPGFTVIHSLPLYEAEYDRTGLGSPDGSGKNFLYCLYS
jgi:hypothetical protein